VRFGLNHPFKDIQQNIIGTFNVLEAMRVNNIFHIGFSSTGSVYGEATQFPTPENAAFPVQTSLYGTSKLSSEGLTTSYCEGFNFNANIFRFVGILGERYTHGHVFDFFKKLKFDSSQLEILGDGKQKKSYLYVQDCIDAMLIAEKYIKNKINIYNLGLDSYVEVNDSVNIICRECNYESSHNEYDYFLQLPLVLNVTDLSELYRLYKSTELLNNDNSYKCEKCNRKVIARKRTTITKWPNNLIIVLKRFDNKLRKNNTLIDIPLEWRHGYKLKGGIIHSGDSNGGHYIYFGEENNIWFEANDSHIRNINISSYYENIKRSYILLFQKDL
jgi:nucleoside-diphosphate-sugar epimerase